jgi:hypothetical protein
VQVMLPPDSPQMLVPITKPTPPHTHTTAAQELATTHVHAMLPPDSTLNGTCLCTSKKAPPSARRLHKHTTAQPPRQLLTCM